MLRLNWLKIHRLRSVTPGTELHFGPKFNVLLGKNASGKTTLLDLVSAILDDDLTRYDSEEEQGYHLEYKLAMRDHDLRVTASMLPRDPAPPRDNPMGKMGVMGRHPRVRTWSLDITDALGGPLFQCTVKGSSGRYVLGSSQEVTFGGDDGSTASWSISDALMKISHAGASEDEKAFWMAFGIHWFVQRWFQHAPRFDEALDAFHRMNGASCSIQAAGAQHACHFYPASVVMQMIRRLKVNPDDYSHSFDFSDVPELSRVLPLLGFAKAKLQPKLEKRASNNGDTIYDFKDIDFVFSRASGDLLRGDLLSFGQKRLLSFYWYLAVRTEMSVVADELANGLHHEWIEACVGELGERQSFLATQNPLLLDYLPVGRENTTMIHCSMDSEAGHGQMRWRDFTEEEQQRLDRAYEVGIQQVSEILRSEGLW